jgi:hypothetical protein
VQILISYKNIPYMKRNSRYVFSAALVCLALAELLCEDLAVLADSPVFVRRLLVCAGFAFDLFFTAQFLVGLYTASLNRKARGWLLREGGWIDFLAAIPLLVLYSGPAMFGLAAGGLSLLPRVLRVTRGLRFLRFLKLFRLGCVEGGRGGASLDAGKSAAAFLVSVLIAAGAFLWPMMAGSGGLERRVLDNYSAAALRLSHASASSPGAESNKEHEIREYSRTDGDLLLVKQEAAALYSRYASPYYTLYYSGADYLHLRSGVLDFYFSLKPLLAEDARRSVSGFCVLAVIFPAFFLYSRIKKPS